jgi:basic membrane protein A
VRVPCRGAGLQDRRVDYRYIELNSTKRRQIYYIKIREGGTKMFKKFGTMVVCLLVVSLLVGACGTAVPAPATSEPAVEQPTASTETSAPEEPAALEIPEAVEGKFNVAMVLPGPKDDGGWSQAHYTGIEYVGENVPNAHVAYIENVPEGTQGEQVFRSLSRKGFDLIFGATFGYMDAMETVASEFPDITYVHLNGYKSNMTNFGNLYGAHESMQYLAGMLAGARAKKDGKPKVGFMASFPIPEEFRMSNALMLGMQKTCPECTLEVRWMNTWYDPAIEREAASSLFDAGADVVATRADTPTNVRVAEERGGWGITVDWPVPCAELDRCLTSAYFEWGPVYARVAEEVIAGTYKPGWDYFDADSGGLGLWGFMPGQSLPPGAKDLDPADIKLVQDTLAKMLKGEFTRFDIFTGPINDNTGKLLVPEGEKLTQNDLNQFPPGEASTPCAYCMHWFAEGIETEVPEQ